MRALLKMASEVFQLYLLLIGKDIMSGPVDKAALHLRGLALTSEEIDAGGVPLAVEIRRRLGDILRDVLR